MTLEQRRLLREAQQLLALSERQKARKKAPEASESGDDTNTTVRLTRQVMDFLTKRYDFRYNLLTEETEFRPAGQRDFAFLPVGKPDKYFVRSRLFPVGKIIVGNRDPASAEILKCAAQLYGGSGNLFVRISRTYHCISRKLFARQPDNPVFPLSAAPEKSAGADCKHGQTDE